jgi:hypothetical protein
VPTTSTCARERTGGERPSVDHLELARRREESVHEHQQADGVDAVVPTKPVIECVSDATGIRPSVVAAI